MTRSRAVLSLWSESAKVPPPIVRGGGVKNEIEGSGKTLNTLREFPNMVIREFLGRELTSLVYDT